MILYGVYEASDYEGGGLTSVFSTYEKAKAHYDKTALDVCGSKEIIEVEVDNPLFEGERYDYEHG